MTFWCFPDDNRESIKISRTGFRDIAVVNAPSFGELIVLLCQYGKKYRERDTNVNYCWTV